MYYIKDVDYILAVKNNQKHLYEDIQYSLNNDVDMLVDQTIDVPFGEYASRKSAGHSARDFSTLNKMAVNLLKNETALKIGD